jgi:hypothetical protein
VVVANEWMSVIYVLLDQLNDRADAVEALAAAAVEQGKFNLAYDLLRLLSRRMPHAFKARSAGDARNLYRLLANAPSTNDSTLLIKLFTVLSTMQTERLYEHKTNASINPHQSCPSLVDAARTHNFTFMKTFFEQFDIDTSRPNDGMLLANTFEQHTPFTALFDRLQLIAGDGRACMEARTHA